MSATFTSYSTALLGIVTTSDSAKRFWSVRASMSRRHSVAQSSTEADSRVVFDHVAIEISRPLTRAKQSCPFSGMAFYGA